ncbi:MAG: argininosuccinate synthase [Christensenella sp.]|uniref:argininosuccinate synthase n=1 Tax=Christensenella sp. TaxID=1935934 RepID=UPI002B1F7103|nr:argininosuccinate synthase [Christensenella sp.]MEA5003238.1 argininosuccinate synthase [Christensenella sp.]
MKQYNKVVLAYSGGLDTSIIIPWLKETYGVKDVIAVCGNVGQGKELDGLYEKAINTGASDAYIEDLTEEFITDYVFPTMQAGAVYEGKYLLGTSFARPVIAKRLVEIAKEVGADAICHGATGKGNDQVRFELTVKALAPELDIIAPWRIWDLKSREEEIEYAQARNIPIPVDKEHNYSMDANIWHLSHEGADLEDPWNEPKDDLYMICKTPEEAPDKPCYFTIEFEKGIPVSIDGKQYGPVEMVTKLNELGAENGVGIDDLVENRLVGMKSRGVYENPGGRILYTAHAALEMLTLDKDTSHYKEGIGAKYAELVYDGKWFCPLRESLAAFVEETQKTVTGTVRMKLYKGNCVHVGIQSPYSLYIEEFATVGEVEVYDHKDAEGFINLFGLPLKMRALALKDKEI